MLVTRFLTSAIPLVVLASVVAASRVSIEDGKISIQSIDGTARSSQKFSTGSPPQFPAEVQLEADDVVRVTFNVQKKNDDGSASEDTKWKAHQVILVASDAEAVKDSLNDEQRFSESSVVPIKGSGKGTWSLRLSRISPILASAPSGKLTLTLLAASFASSSADPLTPAHLNLGTFSLPDTIVSAARAALEEGASPALDTPRHHQQKEQGFLGPWEEHSHTFATPPSETMPKPFISAAAAAVTFVVPWIVLIGLLSPLPLGLLTPSLRAGLFLLSLVALELLALRYWIGAGMTVFTVIPWLLSLGLVATFLGKGALGEMGGRRLKGQGRPTTK